MKQWNGCCVGRIVMTCSGSAGTTVGADDGVDEVELGEGGGCDIDGGVGMPCNNNQGSEAERDLSTSADERTNNDARP
jgi:hypothetical protein